MLKWPGFVSEGPTEESEWNLLVTYLLGLCSIRGFVEFTRPNIGVVGLEILPGRDCSTGGAAIVAAFPLSKLGCLGGYVVFLLNVTIFHSFSCDGLGSGVRLDANY